MPAPFTKTVRGVEVPTIGLGVFEVDPGETEDAVADALAAGYRHVDTAGCTRTRRRPAAASRAQA